MKPSVGRIVHFRETGKAWNGSETCPAIITKVHSDTCVNLTVFPDAHSPFTVAAVCNVGKDMQRWSWPEKVA